MRMSLTYCKYKLMVKTVNTAVLLLLFSCVTLKMLLDSALSLFPGESNTNYMEFYTGFMDYKVVGRVPGIQIGQNQCFLSLFNINLSLVQSLSWLPIIFKLNQISFLCFKEIYNQFLPFQSNLLLSTNISHLP